MIYKQFKQEPLTFFKNPKYPKDPNSGNGWYIGRQGSPIEDITVHHAVTEAPSILKTFNNPQRRGSTHFYVTPTRVIQMLDTKDTAFANSQWHANLNSITFETAGCWLDAPEYTRMYQWTLANQDKILANMKVLFKALLTDHPQALLTYHNDFGKTACPAELKSRKIAKMVFELAKQELGMAPTPVVAEAPVKYYTTTDISNKEIVVMKNPNTELHDINFPTGQWHKSPVVASYPPGTKLTVDRLSKNTSGGIYEIPVGQPNNYGINVVDRQNIDDLTSETMPTPAPVKMADVVSAIPTKVVDTSSFSVEELAELADRLSKVEEFNPIFKALDWVEAKLRGASMLGGKQ